MKKVIVNRICPRCEHNDDVKTKLTAYQLEQLRDRGRAYVACPTCGEYGMAALIISAEDIAPKEPAFGKAPSRLADIWRFSKDEKQSD